MNVGAPLTKPLSKPSAPAANSPKNPVSEFIGSKPHLPFPGVPSPSVGIGLSIKGCLKPKAP